MKRAAPGAREERRKAERAPSFAEQTSAIDDATGPLGIRVVSQRVSERLRLVTRGARMIFPLDVSAVDVEVGGARYAADRASWVLTPARTAVVIEARTLAAHTLVLEPSEGLVDHAVATYESVIGRDLFARYLREAAHLPRTTWQNEIVHRYMFERAACARRDNEATAFLETEIAKELYFACHDRAAGLPCTPVGRVESGLVRRAREHIEAHLFEPDVLAGLAKASGASASTVLRAFQREVGAAPLSYLRARRLDEALLLLKTRRAGVGEVSMMVGYRSLPAFSEAFRARFGRRPSDVLAESRHSR